MSLANILRMLRADVDELYNKVARAAQAGNALQNRAYTTGFATAPTAPTAGSSLFVGACKLTAKKSGIFLASVSYACTGMTATDTIDTTITTQEEGAGLAITNAVPAGPGTVGAGLGTVCGAYVSTAAAGILVTGGPFNSVTQFDTGAQVLPTAGTTYQFNWTGVIYNGVAATTPAGIVPFPVGNDVVLLCGVNRSAATQVFAGFAMSLLELP